MSMADDIINGDFCEQCGTYLGEGDGFPRLCKACNGEWDEQYGDDEEGPNA